MPMSLTALSADSLVDRNQVQLENYVREVPGFSFSDQGNGQTSLTLRGISTGGLTNSTVGITVDDVPFGSGTALTYGSQTSLDLDPAVLSQIEVLRGPQGTLYGAASLGGLLKYVTRDPSLTEFKGRVQAGLSKVADGDGTGDSFRGSVEFPLVNDVLGVSLSGFSRRDPGYVDDPAQGRKDVNTRRVSGGRVAALWKISDVVSLRLSGLLQDSRSDGTSVIDTLGDLAITNGLTHDDLRGTGGYRVKSQLYAANLTARWDRLSFTSITAYNKHSYYSLLQFPRFYGLAESIFGVPGSSIIDDFSTKKFSQEFRLASTGDKLDWLIGLFYTDEKTQSFQSIPVLNPANGNTVGSLLVSDFPLRLKESAVFADLTYHFTDRFNVQVGGRFSHNKQTYDETDTGLLIGADPFVLPTETSKDDAFTFLVTPQYKVSEDLMWYARAASGYRVGGPNPSAELFGLPPTFKADKTLNFEVGVKGSLFERALSYDLAAYFIDWRDIQLSQRDAATQFSYFSNAGKARSQGLELSIQSRRVHGFSGGVSLSFNDAKLKKDLPAGAYGLSGDRLPYSARFTASVTGDQEFALSERFTGFVGASIDYTGSRFDQFPSTPPPVNLRAELPSYTVADLRAGVRDDHWTVQAYVNNVGNKRGIISAGGIRPDLGYRLTPMASESSGPVQPV
ncbi:MAG: TonB-dependent receptor [Steroidobacteraceae bacterium]